MTSIRGRWADSVTIPAAAQSTAVVITVTAPATASAAAPAPSFLALVDTLNNEGVVTSEYAIATLGGTVAYTTSRFHQGAQGLRLNRTGTTRHDATRSSKWGSEKVYSGQFWAWFDALPTAEIAIAQIPYSVGNNIELRLGPTGAFKTGRQGGASSASASATTITTGAWFRISWWVDSSTGTLSVNAAVNDDTPVGQTWAQTAEAPAEWAYGARLVTTASTFDMTVDEGRQWIGTFTRTAMPASGTTITVDAPATAAAAALAPSIRVSFTAAVGAATGAAPAPTAPISLTAATAAAAGAGVAPACQFQPHPPPGTAAGAGVSAGIVVTLTAATAIATAAAAAPGGVVVVSPPTATAGGAGVAAAAVGVAFGSATATATGAAAAPTAPASLTAATGQATAAGVAPLAPLVTLTAGPGTATGAAPPPAIGSTTLTATSPATAAAAALAPTLLVSIPMPTTQMGATGAGTQGSMLASFGAGPATASAAALAPTASSAGTWTPDTPGTAAGVMLEPTVTAHHYINVDRGNPPNLVDTSFESGTDTFTYQDFPTANADGTVAQSSAQAHTGSNSLKLDAATTVTGTLVAATRFVATVAYRRYVATSWVYLDTVPAGFVANIIFAPSLGTQGNTAFNVATIGSWQQRSVEGTTGNSAAQSTVSAIRLTGTSGLGAVVAYADDVTVAEVAGFAIGVAQGPGIRSGVTAAAPAAASAAMLAPTVAVSAPGAVGQASGQGTAPEAPRVAFTAGPGTGSGAMQQPTFSTGVPSYTITIDAPATATATATGPSLRVAVTSSAGTAGAGGVSPSCRIGATPGVATATAAGTGPGIGVRITMSGTGDAAGTAPSPVLAVGIIAMQYGVPDSADVWGIDTHPAGGIDAGSAVGIDHYAPQGVDVG